MGGAEEFSKSVAQRKVYFYSKSGSGFKFYLREVVKFFCIEGARLQEAIQNPG